MPSPHFTRFLPNLTHLDDRCTPAITVNSLNWNAAQAGTLPWAIASANAAVGQDEIVFNNNDLGDTPVFNVPANETLEVTDGVIIQAGGGGVYVTIRGATPFNFSHNKPEGVTASVINGGYFDACSGIGSNDGGAVMLTGGKLSLNYNRFVNNTAGSGGAIYLTDGTTLVVGTEQGTPPVPSEFPETGVGSSAVLFKGNTAAADGGAIQNLGGRVELRRAVFVDNVATGDGGAMNVTLSGSVLVAPPAPANPPPGGPLGGVQVTLPEVSFVRNGARDGGAINFLSGGKGEFIEAIFAGNQATRDGGAVRHTNGDLTFTKGTFYENSAAGDGGAVRVSGGTVAIDRTTFEQNSAGVSGGAIAVGGAGGTVTAVGAGFSGNTAVVPNTWHIGPLPGGTYTDTNCTYS